MSFAHDEAVNATEGPADANFDDSKETEEYAYLERGGFSSEKFKIEIRGLPKYYGIAEIKKLMNQRLGLNASKIKRPNFGSRWLYACFQNDEDRNRAIKTLNGFDWKGKTLFAYIAEPAPDPLFRKRKLEEERALSSKKDKRSERDGPKKSLGKSQDEKLKDATTPFWNVPYEEQIKLKQAEVKRLLLKMDNELWKIDLDMRAKIEANRKKFDGLSFEVIPIDRSPNTVGYRNKCEFTVGTDEETNLPTVGFRLGAYATGTVAVAPVGNLIHISDKTKKVVLLFEDFVRKSGLPPFSPADYTGYWRYLAVRESSATGDMMVIPAFYKRDLTDEVRDKLREDLIEHFSSEEAKALKITSLYYSELVQRRSNEVLPKPIHLKGTTHLTDTILTQNFRISPEAFFQINTASANILYQRAIDLCAPRPDSTVLDICCGTGSIGLCFAKHCGRVLGLELVEEAVKDAKANAELNKIENCDFFVGKAEDILPSVLARAIGDDIIAIVDPPRAGLHMRAITQLRNTRKIKRLLYVSCSPSAAVKNFVDLARPVSKTLRGPPFVPVKAASVDMFPYTKHVELIILFERSEEPNTGKSGDLME